MTFPVRWTKPNFKTPIAKKVVSGLRRKARVSKEQAQMQAVRKEDRFCRFPLCGCKAFKLRQDVCHTVHRGVGGNPAGDRSDTAFLILLCSARHRENIVSLDRKTMRIRPLTRLGLRGPCAFDVDAQALLPRARVRWVEVGREKARHYFEPFTPEQRVILEKLKGMEL